MCVVSMGSVHVECRWAVGMLQFVISKIWNRFALQKTNPLNNLLKNKEITHLSDFVSSNIHFFPIIAFEIMFIDQEVRFLTK